MSVFHKDSGQNPSREAESSQVWKLDARAETLAETSLPFPSERLRLDGFRRDCETSHRPRTRLFLHFSVLTRVFLSAEGGKWRRDVSNGFYESARFLEIRCMLARSGERLSNVL